MRRRVLVFGLVLVIIALFVFAWSQKPEPLKSSIERAGIHLKLNDDQIYDDSGFYAISEVDEAKLKSLALSRGFVYSYMSGPDMLVQVYTLDRRFLYFWHLKQEISFDRATMGNVWIKPRLR